jgi:hypothetical protein
MGINKSVLYGLMYAAEHDMDFKNTLTIGRQQIYYANISKILHGYTPPHVNYAEELFRYFGAESVDSIDYSDYEGATIIHDMNNPVDSCLKNKYSLVFDGGALEHVFNYPLALKNCMDMVKPKGHLVLYTPANNDFGHGFYQFSPELFFSVLCEKNGYTDTKIFMHDDFFRWYEVVSPKHLGERITMCLPNSHRPLYMLVVSKKTGVVPDVLFVMQSDYVDLWSKPAIKNQKVSLLKKTYRLVVPKIIRLRVGKIVQRMKYRKYYIRVNSFPRTGEK